MKLHRKLKECHICYKAYTCKDPKVRDHCHYTGKYRGPVHELCNLMYKIPPHIPVVFHNLSGYDTHLFIKELQKKSENIEVIAKNKEDYISFSTKVVVNKYLDFEGNKRGKGIEIRFIDSFKFMTSSLDSLVKNLVKSNHEFFGLDDSSGLLTKKAIYPYEYMTSWEKFSETQLPPIEKFYSELSSSEISKDDYQHTQEVWREFGIKDLGEYHDLYLKTNVVLLANVFEAFRSTCLKHYKLNPAHFYMSSGLAWKACLKKTEIELELLTDSDMLMMVERGIRGGITQEVYRYANADNKYMEDDFSNSEDSTYLQYLDANNLYRWVMSQPLPSGGFKWIGITVDQVSDLSKGIDKGYLDVKYPPELHDSHNDLPFLCERMKINNVEKLVPNLYDKRSYVIHIRALMQAIDHGLILEKVHRVIEFDQSAWMKPYIDFNRNLRTQAKNDFEKNFFTLMNNAVFGKTMENIRKHRNIKLVTNRETYLKTIMKPNFKSGILFSKNLMGY